MILYAPSDNNHINYFTGQTQILVDIQQCDRLRITVDFAALLMTRPGGTHSNISMKVHNISIKIEHIASLVCVSYCKPIYPFIVTQITFVIISIQ